MHNFGSARFTFRVVWRLRPFEGLDTAPTLSDHRIDPDIIFLSIDLKPSNRPFSNKDHLFEFLFRMWQSGYDEVFKTKPPKRRSHGIDDIIRRRQGLEILNETECFLGMVKTASGHQ